MGNGVRLILLAWMAVASTTGAARAEFIQTIERDSDSEMYYWDFSATTDLVAGSSPGTLLSAVPSPGWSSDFTVGGLAWDGTRFIQAIERDSSSELYYWSFDSVADLVAGSSAGTLLSVAPSPGWNSSFTVGGLAHVGSSANVVPEPGTWTLLSAAGLLALWFRRRR